MGRIARHRVPVAGRVVAITGGARGIGRATAEALAREGARVALGDVDGDQARDAAQEIGGASVGLDVDVTDRSSFARFLDGAETALGPVDVLVNNAGVMALGPFVEEDEAVTRRQVDVNVHGVINGMRCVLPRMRRRGRGHVINVGSVSGRVAAPGQAVYAATKYAVFGLSEVVRGELRGTPIELSVVLPGPVATDLGAGMRRARGIVIMEPEQVAGEIVRTVAAPRFEVWVPRQLRWWLSASMLLPRPLRERGQRFFGTGLISTRVDWGERRRYMEQAFGASGSAGQRDRGAE